MLAIGQYRASAETDAVLCTELIQVINMPVDPSRLFDPGRAERVYCEAPISTVAASRPDLLGAT